MGFDTGFFTSHNFILLIVGLLFGSSFMIAIFYRPAEFEHTRAKLFFSILASIAVLLVGLNLLFTSVTFEYNRLYTRTLVVKQINTDLWLKPNQLFANSIHARPEFLASFAYNNPTLYQIAVQNKTTGPLTTQAVLEEQNIAVVIFQAWEDFLNNRLFDTLGSSGSEAWFGCFLVWAQSPFLKEYFYIFKHSYDNTTVRLAELLFEYAAKLPVPTTDPALYPKTIEKILQDSRVIQLFSEATRS